MNMYRDPMAGRITRRASLLGLTTALSLGRASMAVAAAPTERRFVVVILRGALDGLSAVVPYGDPNLAALRPALLPPMPGQERGLLDLGGTFGLHPALAASHAMYRMGQLRIVHAVAADYRVRSHFEAQDYLESGADHRLNSGWLNRVAASIRAPAGAITPAPGGMIIPAPRGTLIPAPGGTLIPAPGGTMRVSGPGIANAMAVGLSVPLLLRGPAPIANWAPHGFAEANAAVYQAILALHAADPITGPAIASGLRDRGFGDQVMAAGVRDDEAPRTVTEPGMSGMAGAAAGKKPDRFAFPALARAAGAMLRAPNGPRLAALELGGWDTHTGQVNRLVPPLTQLDAGLEAMRVELGQAWNQTVVLVMTEFGRTARMNGTNGTDHGTATVAFLAGGAVAGGKVTSTWPGLRREQLFENRDLAPTTDLRAIAKGVLAAHLGLDGSALGRVFPGGTPVDPMMGLVRAG